MMVVMSFVTSEKKPKQIKTKHENKTRKQVRKKLNERENSAEKI